MNAELWQCTHLAHIFPFQLGSVETDRVPPAYRFFLISIYGGLLKLVHPLIKTALMSQLTSQLVLQLVAQLNSSYCSNDLIFTRSLRLYPCSYSITALIQKNNRKWADSDSNESTSNSSSSDSEEDVQCMMAHDTDEKGKFGIGYAEPENSKSSWLKNRQDKDRSKAGSQSSYLHQQRHRPVATGLLAADAALHDDQADEDRAQDDEDHAQADEDRAQADADRAQDNDPNKSVINLDEEDEGTTLP
ncbi:hypothetical protein F511_38527 [Dorcoceras hygrometricum]|uniref:Uncharacterized protein n=1 Tax=Dorcoceras hygrometricum TaxID=472368 RepID=A0A2Z7CLJ4_9LAMI|nr:hypothetical protein F511_38527 [Dorcoceras hygrometricum]